ncbi:unnamed protein product [Musa acuminata var. zebrina]
MRPLVPLLFLLLSAVVSTSHALASAPSSRKALGGWTPIKNTDDPHVREIAEFAIAEHNNQANASLALSKVVKGETQVVAGTNYRLVLQVKDASGARVKYQAVVWEKPWENFRQLTSFKLVKS